MPTCSCCDPTVRTFSFGATEWPGEHPGAFARRQDSGLASGSGGRCAGLGSGLLFLSWTRVSGTGVQGTRLVLKGAAASLETRGSSEKEKGRDACEGPRSASPSLGDADGRPARQHPCVPGPRRSWRWDPGAADPGPRGPVARPAQTPRPGGEAGAWEWRARRVRVFSSLSSRLREALKVLSWPWVFKWAQRARPLGSLSHQEWQPSPSRQEYPSPWRVS